MSDAPFGPPSDLSFSKQVRPPGCLVLVFMHNFIRLTFSCYVQFIALWLYCAKDDYYSIRNRRNRKTSSAYSLRVSLKRTQRKNNNNRQKLKPIKSLFVLSSSSSS